MTLQGQVEVLDAHGRLRSAAVVACQFRINESSIRTIAKKEKEIGKSHSRHKHFAVIFCKIPFNHIVKRQFLCGYRIALRKA